MKFFQMMLVFLFGLSTAFAEPTATAGADASANAVVNSSPTTVSAAGVKLEQGAVTNTATVGSSAASNGNMEVRTGDTNITFQAAKVPNTPPPAGYVPLVSGSSPQIFGALSGTANERGIDLELYYANVCHSGAVRGIDLASRVYSGASENTEIAFTPHLNYAKATKKPATAPFEQAVWAPKVAVEEVTPKFNDFGHYKCLGVMTITAKGKKAGEVTLSTVLADASQFPLKEMEGFKEITLLSTVDVISATKGVDNQGGGVGVGAGLSKFFDPVLGTVGGSAGTSSGVTFPETKIGVTFLVLVEDPNGVLIDLRAPKKKQPVTEPAPEPIAQAKVEPVPPPAVLFESKPGAVQDVAVIPEKVKPMAPKKKHPKKVAKKVVPGSTPEVTTSVIQCNGCTVNGTVTVPKKDPKPINTSQLEEHLFVPRRSFLG